MMFYIYILYSPSSDKYYTGYTSDYQVRLQQHNTQEYFNTYTAKHRPWLMVSVFKCGNEENEAVKLERFIKKQKSRKLIEQLVNPSFIPGGALAQLFRVPDVRD